MRLESAEQVRDVTTIVWFRLDLRLADNPALAAAAARGPVVPVYILDDPEDDGWPMGAASRWWLHASLSRLRERLGGLVLLRGDPAPLLKDLARRSGARGIVWNRCYEPRAVARDTAIKAALADAGLSVESFNGRLLHEPWEVKTGAGGPFKVFTPFWRACLSRPVGKPLDAPRLDVAIPGGVGEQLSSWRLEPTRPNWAAGWDRIWKPGEQGAREKLSDFLGAGIAGYGEKRNRPDLGHVSRLSPHLHFGEVSPRQVWSATMFHAAAAPGARADCDKFLSEIGWREFSHHLLFHFPTITDRNWKPSFDAYPWRQSRSDLAAWRRGRTGYPLVDAGLRELWATGTMHNRVRMVAASFLVKHLRIDWREGARWFWDTLLDADLANNSAGWQWVAGSGADAAPYFRIFNPVEQGRKFDPDGNYVRRWCPELARLPDQVLHAPFEAPAEILAAAGVVLGKTYPAPIVDHRTAREAALVGYDKVKAAQAE